MYSYAQTNIQLINQLRREGYSNEEIVCVLKVYELAISFFTGQFQSSGKTQIAHGVGTASILASLHVPAELVAAGLIHNVYGVGDFGDGRIGISDSRRELVRDAVGKEVEEYVYGFRFFSMRGKLRNLIAYRDSLDELSKVERNVLLIRLADQLDHHLYLGRIYHRRDIQICRDYVNHNGDIMVEMAEKLGFPALASELARVFRETMSAEIPEELLSQISWQKHHFVIAPKSYRKRPSVVLCHLLVQGLNRLRSFIKSRKMLGFMCITI